MCASSGKDRQCQRGGRLGYSSLATSSLDSMRGGKRSVMQSVTLLFVNDLHAVPHRLANAVSRCE